MRFSNVVAYVESVGRRKTSTWGGLDTMTCFWTGPTAIAYNFFPIVEQPLGNYVPFIRGSSHPEFPAMFVKSVRQTDEAAGITAFEIDYVGMFNVTKGANWTSAPIVSRKTSVQTLSFSFAAYSLGVTVEGIIEAFLTHGTQTVTYYYLSSQVRIEYRSQLMQPFPLFKSIATSEGISGVGLLSYNIFRTVLSPYSGSSAAAFNNPAATGQILGDDTIYYPVNKPPDFITSVEYLDFTSEPEGVWYKTSETWQTILRPPQMITT